MDARKLGLILIPAFMLPVIGVLVTGAIIGSAVPDSRGSLVFIAVPIIAVCMFAGRRADHRGVHVRGGRGPVRIHAYQYVQEARPDHRRQTR
jgi:hypothetical protein